jgi:radical SAM protein with 4Fe4S-binding SPASM domain
MRKFSAPTVVNLEITDVCNVKCRHCYNFWRDDNSSLNTMEKEKFDSLVEMFVDAGVFHVVLTGGEPMTKMNLLEHGFKKLVDNNISISLNSNLMYASDEKIKQLKSAGVEHILTSLNSYDKETNDYMVHQKGAFDKIIRGIKNCIKNGIRVSVNMIVSDRNKEHVYKTALLAHELGCQKIFGTRVVPSVNECNPNATEFVVTKDDAISTLDQLVRAKEETGIMIGTLVSYPLCLLSDLDKYKDFVGRGCPAQTGHIMSLNSNGNTHACVHEEKDYGNIFRDGIYKTYENMMSWHDGSYLFDGCKGCDYIEICQSGCRMSAHAHSSDLSEKDNFMVNKDNFIKPYHIVYDESIYDKIDQGLKFTVPKRIRFREEKDFYLLNIRWANTITIPTDVAEILIKCQNNSNEFSLDDIGIKHRKLLAKLFFKDAVESAGVQFYDKKNMEGLGANVE